MLVALCFTSCSFFTTSLGTSFKRDLSDTYDKMSTSELADMITDPQLMCDPDAGKQLLASLGEKDDLTSLKPEVQNDILNLMVNSTISTEAITSVIDTLTNAGDNSDPADIISGVLDNINAVDTKATVALLDESNIGNLNPSTAALAAVSLVAQVAKSSDIFNKLDDVMTELGTVAQTPDSGRDAAISTAVSNLGIKTEDVEALEVAFKAVASLADSNAELFPGITLGSLFGAQQP